MLIIIFGIFMWSWFAVVTYQQNSPKSQYSYYATDSKITASKSALKANIALLVFVALLSLITITTPLFYTALLPWGIFTMMNMITITKIRHQAVIN